jgi:hypothetical protein
MIFGNCPYEDCDADFTTSMGESPRFEKHSCEKCGRVIWTLHSRIQPESYTQEGFALKYDVDEETKHITER